MFANASGHLRRKDRTLATMKNKTKKGNRESHG